MKNQNVIIKESTVNNEDLGMEENIQIKEINGVDIVQYQPKGVCCKLMQFKIKDNIIQEVEFAGGCNGNLSGIGVLVKGMSVESVITKLRGINCGSRSTSCPDQLTKGIEAYVQAKHLNLKQTV